MSRTTRSRRRPGARARGFTIVEGLVSMVIISVMITASLGVIGSSARDRQKALEMRRAHDLANMLLNEITSLPFQDITVTPTFGPEHGERTSPREFDDIDDYNGFTQTNPEYSNRAAIPGLTGWKWSATVSRAQMTQGGPVTASTSTGCLLITTTATSPRGYTATTQAVRSRWGGVDTLMSRSTMDLPRVHLRADAASGGITPVTSVELLNVPVMP